MESGLSIEQTYSRRRFRIVQHLVGQARFTDLSVVHYNNSGRDLPDDMDIVRDEQEGRSALAVDVRQEL